MPEKPIRSTERFTSRVRDYVIGRPPYPHAVLGALRERGFLPPNGVVADLAAGTGISSEMFLAAGHEVYAVEPNAAMRQAATDRLGPQYPRFHAVAATAESTSLPDSKIDLIMVAQALHWLDLDQCRIEFRRILRPNGALAVLYNLRQLEASDLMRDHEALVARFGVDYAKVKHRHPDAAALTRLFGSPAYETLKFDNPQELDRQRFLARALSSSYLPGEGHVRFPELLEALNQLFDTHAVDGRITFANITELYCGRLMR